MNSDSVLSRVPLFATLPPIDLVLLEATLRQATYPAGAVLFNENDQGDRLYVVLQGQIAIIKALGTADERLLGLRGPSELVGEMSFFSDDRLRTASAYVHATAQVLEITHAEFDALLHRYPALSFEIVRVLSKRLRAAQNATICDLHEKNNRLAQAYAELQAAQAQIVEQETLARELQLAREIQESMLPPTLPQLHGYSIGAIMNPARLIGGDFYDVFPISVDMLGVVIGDVSGKGVPAALVMALCCSLVRAEASRTVLPEEVLRSVNHHLLDRNLRGMFVTVLFGILQQATREFTYVRAGHQYPLVWDAAGVTVALEGGRAHPLGLFPHPVLDVRSITLPVGSTLLLYTDGVTEAMDEHQELFGIERLCATASAQPKASAQELCDCIVHAVTAHRDATPQSDDITLLAVRAIAG